MGVPPHDHSVKAGRSGRIFFRSLTFCLRPWAPAATFLRRPAEAAFSTAFAGAAEASRPARSPGSTLTSSAAGTAHHAAHALHGGSHLILGNLAVGVFIHAGKTAFNLLLGEFGILLLVDTAVGILVHPSESFGWIEATGTSRAAGLALAFRWHRTFARRWWGGFFTFRGGASWRAPETAFASFTSGATESSWTSFSARTAHAFAQTFGDLAHLGLVDEAVAVGVHLGEALAVVAFGKLIELLLADLAVSVGVGALEELSDAAAAAFALGGAVLGDGDAGAQSQDTEALEDF